MAISDDIDYDYVNKILKRKTGASATVYSVNAVYSYGETVFDDLTQGDDKMPMGAATPTSYTMENAWYLQEELTRYMKGGAIDTIGYADEIHVLTIDGTYTDFVLTDIGKQIKDDAVDVGALLDYDNVKQKIWVRIGSATVIADNSVITVSGGTGAGDASGDSATGETKISNPYTLGGIVNSPDLYIYQDGVEIVSWWPSGHFDILIKTTEAGIDIDSRDITVFGRRWTDEDTLYKITLTSAGQNAVPLGNKADANNTSLLADVEDLQDGTVANIAVDFNFASPFQYAIAGDGVNHDYTVQMDCDGRRLSDLYEVSKYWTAENTSKVLEVDSDGNSINGEAYRYARLSYGSESVAAPFGTFAGGTFFFAQGVYPINLHADDVQAFQLTDDPGVTRTPPNYQAFDTGGLVAGDNVWCYESEGAASTKVDKSQYSIKAANNVLNEIEVIADIPSSTPSSGYLIVVDDDGSEIHYAYTSFSGKIFAVTIAADVYTGTEKVYVAFLYDNSPAGANITETSTIHTADINVVVRVRQAGYKKYEAAGVYGATGFKATAQRDSNTIYTA